MDWMLIEVFDPSATNNTGLRMVSTYSFAACVLGMVWLRTLHAQHVIEPRFDSRILFSTSIPRQMILRSLPLIKQLVLTKWDVLNELKTDQIHSDKECIILPSYSLRYFGPWWQTSRRWRTR